MGTKGGSHWDKPGTFTESSGALAAFGVKHLQGARITMVDPPNLGSGERFKALTKKLAAKGEVRDPKAVAASIGRKRYGKAKFQSLAAQGRRKAR